MTRFQSKLMLGATTLWLVPSSLSHAAGIDDRAAIDQAAECLHTLDGMNEGRQWAQYRIGDGEVQVLVQSGGEDWVFVELTCSPGNVSEGSRWKLPARVVGKGGRPAEPMLARDTIDATLLRTLMNRARQHADLRGAHVLEFSASYVNAPRPDVVYRATLRDDRRDVSIEFDDGGVLKNGTALDRQELGDAGEPPPSGANLGLEKLTQDPVKVTDYLAGTIGGATKINRFIVDPDMLTVEWVSPTKHAVVMQQWMTIKGSLNSTDEESPPNVNKVCASQPTVAQVKASLARLVSDPAREKRIRRSAMLILECETASGKMKWQLLGGDGVMEAGVALATEDFPL
jgi:hypothetical protein